ncbi:serine/threonine-protein kinase [Streptomyces humi]|uniref:serine/threonine-protein kinase n=1 Tax=Streptomyces humi TaxID=1428620 RepID=UPI0006288EDF|nr:serine/threonine-protein kinase [Streptomyces humi]
MTVGQVRGPRAFRGFARILGGRYRLDALIGSGGAANVHRGFDLRLRRAVAVKLFRAGTGLDTEEDFRSEATILARLAHPGLVTAYDAGTHDGEAFLVMELIDGPTLKSRIAEGPLPCAATAALGAHLGDALAHAHETGIVHRDVKPSNIILDAAGRPHLTDFGISRLLDATTRTATGTLTGTAAYLSPEQVLGQPVGRPADVFALGLVLLESLTGRLEYDGGPLESAIARLHRPPVLPDFLPASFAALLRDMTALDQQTRPSARDCAEALTRLAGTSAEPAACVPRPTIVPRPASVAESASAPRPVSGTVPRTAVDRVDRTHRSLSPAAGAASTPSVPAGRTPAPSRPVSARGRLRARGSAAVLVALAAAGLVVGDGFPHHDTTTEAAPSVTDPTTSSKSDDTAARHDGATSLSHSPSAAAHSPGDSDRVPGARTPAGSAQPARDDVSPPGGDGQATADAAGKGRSAAHGEPPGQARKKRHAKKAAHAK